MKLKRRIVWMLIAAEVIMTAACVCAEGIFVPHPALDPNTSLATRQLGEFGESIIDAGFRARGFQVFNGNVGGNGIDRIAIQRSTDGALAEVRVVEVKTRQTVPEFKLAETKNGPQLSDTWIRNNLERIAREHAAPENRQVAQEILKLIKTNPAIIKRELHGVAVETNRYVVMAVNGSGRVTGVVADSRLTSLLKMLSNRGATQETRSIAKLHLSQFEELCIAKRIGCLESPTIAKATAEGISSLSTRSEISERAALIVKDATEARGWLAKAASQPGVAAAGLTFAIDESFTAWEYCNGSMGKSEFLRKSTQNGAKAVAVGVATQLVYVLAATPHGLVLIGVGIVAYELADRAIAVYEDMYVPKAPNAVELRGIVPARCIAFRMLGDVATSR